MHLDFTLKLIRQMIRILMVNITGKLVLCIKLLLYMKCVAHTSVVLYHVGER